MKHLTDDQLIAIAQKIADGEIDCSKAFLDSLEAEVIRRDSRSLDARYMNVYAKHAKPLRRTTPLAEQEATHAA